MPIITIESPIIEKKILVRDLVKTEFMQIPRETIITTKDTHKWCQRAYKKNKACPNFNNKELCPSVDNKIPFFDDIAKRYDLFHVVYAKFDMAKYIINRSALNPTRTLEQIKCLIYWQSSVKKVLKDKIMEVYHENKHQRFYVLGCGSSFKLSFLNKIYSMEAVGINVFSTMRLNGIKLQLNPVDYVILVCLICSNKEVREFSIHKVNLIQKTLPI